MCLNPKTVGFGLAAIKGIGAAVLEPIVTERQASGPYKNLTDLARRVNLGRVGKKTLELLIQAGALDCLKISRPKLCSLVAELVKYSDTFHQASKAGQGGLFDGAPSQDDGIGEGSWQLSTKESKPGAPDPEWLAKERKLLGVYLTGHPLDFHKPDRKLLARGTLADIDRMVGQRLTAIVIVAAIHERLTKTGRRMASFPS